jgi:hypothetical protein
MVASQDSIVVVSELFKCVEQKFWKVSRSNKCSNVKCTSTFLKLFLKNHFNSNFSLQSVMLSPHCRIQFYSSLESASTVVTLQRLLESRDETGTSI